MLLTLLLFPLIWPFIARRWLRDTISTSEMLLNIVLVAILVSGVWYAGRYHNMSDTEILNGEILSKSRKHGTYIETYSCNCRTVNKTTSCSICTRTHYTVDWDAETTVGNIDLAYIDWTSPAVYALPDPKQYKDCEKGQPASIEHSYDNYVKAAPESLFHLNPKLDVYTSKVPSYPKVHDFYKINRVLSPDTKLDTKDLNNRLNAALKKLGPQKQVNFVVILTEIDDPNYKFAVENAWLAGKKNDVIVYLGLDGEKITWADATVWIKNEGNTLTAVTLRDALSKLASYDPEKITEIIFSTTEQYYKRPEMERFKYLLDEIDPPTWVVILALILSIGGSLGLTFFFHKHEVI